MLVITPDLPYHRTRTAGLAEDAGEVRDARRACAPPLAAVGWSYGGSVISLAAAGKESVAPHLHRRHTVTRRVPGEDLSWIDADPHVLLYPDGRFMLDKTL